eukprot:6942211-Ditylum_brightwellii.AAC.1
MEDLFYCPITLEMMKIPVLAPDGYTYEKSAIENWLNEHGTSPQTRQMMRTEDLVPNRVLQDLIEYRDKMKQQHEIDAISGASSSKEET